MSYKANRKIKFRCVNDPSHEFYRMAYLFWDTQNCPICEKIKNSVGMKYPISVDLWSDLNEKTAMDYSSASSSVVYWKCNNGIHEDYKRNIKSSVDRGFECQKCKGYKARGISVNRIDMIGRQFGELIVDSFSHIGKHFIAYWNCTCSCGAKVVKSGQDMRSGKIITCGNKSLHKTGENNSNWKGGLTELNYSERYSNEYKEWHKAVFERDQYTCQCCGESGGELQAHHLYDFANHEDLRTEESNGITLCKSCHHSTVPGSFHNTYGTIGKTPEELEEYINIRRSQLGIAIPFSLESYLAGDILKPGDISSKENDPFENTPWIFNLIKEENNRGEISAQK